MIYPLCFTYLCVFRISASTPTSTHTCHMLALMPTCHCHAHTHPKFFFSMSFWRSFSPKIILDHDSWKHHTFGSLGLEPSGCSNQILKFPTPMVRPGPSGISGNIPQAYCMAPVRVANSVFQPTCCDHLPCHAHLSLLIYQHHAHRPNSRLISMIILLICFVSIFHAF